MKCFEEHFVLEFKMVEAFSGIGSLRSMARSLQISSLHRMCLVLSSTAAPPPPSPIEGLYISPPQKSKHLTP